MGNTKKPTSERSRITRPTAPKAPRAARKKTTLPDTAAEVLAPAADVAETETETVTESVAVAVAVSASEPVPVARPDEPTQPIPWVPFREQARVRATTWLGLDARAIVRGAVRRIGRAIGRRFPLVGRVGGFIFRAW